MKTPFYISLLLGCLLEMAACTGPVILEEEENTNTEAGEEDTAPTWEPVPIIHEGTYDSPYSISEAQTLGRGKNVWIEGYIVGCVNNSMKSGCNFTQEATTTSNVLIADTFPTDSENAYLYRMPVELPNGSIERDDLNLYDNPDNYHRKVRIEGDVTLYFKKPGIKEITDYIFVDEINYEPDEEKPDENETEDKPEEPYKPHDPNATRQDTLNIAEGIKLQNKGEQVYIRGYIVGYYNSRSHKILFNPSTEQINTLAENNIVLADNINETDPDNVIIVDLPTGTALRREANLKDNPQNLLHAITVKGMMSTFRETGYHGCMDTQSNYLGDEDYYFSIE